SGMIHDPITLPHTARVGEALKLMKEFKIGGIPIVNGNQTLVGIVTDSDLRFEKNVKRPVTEVMTKENLVTTAGVKDLKTAERILVKHKIEKLPVIDKHKKLIGLITYKSIQKSKQPSITCKDELGRLRVGAAIGITEDSMKRAEALATQGVDVL